MRSILRRAAALALTAALLVPTALASDALGSRIYSYTLDICDRTTLTREVMWSASKSDLREENYVTYTPSASVSPKVGYGANVLDKQTVYSMAKALERDGERVLSGINGDYFVMATGNPLGLVVTDGDLRSSASYLSALGFLADGSAVIGKPELTLRANFGGYSMQINHINKIRDGNAFYLFTDDFGANTKNTKDGYDVILTPLTDDLGQTVPSQAHEDRSLTVSDTLGIGRVVSCRVDEVIEAKGATAIPAGKFVLSVSDEGGEWFRTMIRTLQPGDTVDIEVSSADSRWNDVQEAVGAMYQLVRDGAVLDGLDAATTGPRTAVGVKPDGSVLFYTLDGRQKGHSIGATIKMVAQRLVELGCTEAVLLDGGGSTTLVSTYPDYTGVSTVNSPSEGNARAVTNAVFLTSNLSPTGTPGSLYVTAKSLTLLPGASTQCVAACVDTGWYPTQLPGAVSWSATGGTVADDGTFTAPAEAGTYTVTATSGGVTGSMLLNVIGTPDAIDVRNEATNKNVSKLSLKPGQSVDLTASASYRTVGLTGGDGCFSWTCDPAVGTITGDGRFTAAGTTATGKIKVACGNYAVTIAVSVNDDAPPAIDLTLTGGVVTAAITDEGEALGQDQISLRLDGQSLPFTWDGTTLTAALGTLDDSLHRVTVSAVDAAGNRARASATLPASTDTTPFADMTGHWAAPYTTRLSAAGILNGVTEGGTTRFLPDRPVTRGDFALMAARWMGLDLSAYQKVSLPYADAASIPSWDLDAVKALYDKGIMKGSQGKDGKLYANAKSSVTRAEAITILGRMLESGYPEASLKGFSDASAVPSWAKSYTAQLVGLDIVGGSNGQLRPTASITRAEVAKLLWSMW